MNLFEFTYCGNYNRQIEKLSRMSPEKWSFGDTNDNGILKGYLENTFKRLYEEGKVVEKKNMPFFIQDSLIVIISQFMPTLCRIWCRTDRTGIWMDFIQTILC